MKPEGKEKVHIHVSTQMSFIAFRISDGTEIFFSFDPTNLISQLLPLGAFYQLVLEVGCVCLVRC